MIDSSNKMNQEPARSLDFHIQQDKCNCGFLSIMAQIHTTLSSEYIWDILQYISVYVDELNIINDIETFFLIVIDSTKLHLLNK